MTVSLEDRKAVGGSLERKAVSGAAWVTAEMVGVQATSFIVFATIAHFLQPRDFGLMSICYFAVQSLEMIVLYNISTVIVRKQNVTALEYTTAFWITTGTAILMFLGLVSLASEAQILFHAPGLAPVLRSMSVIILFIGLSRTHETWLMRNFQFRSLGIRGVAGAVIGGCTGVVLAIHGWGVNALVGQQIVTSTISTALLWLVCPWRPTLNFSIPAAREVFSFMCRMLPNNVVYALTQNCDTFLIALLFGPASAGIYNVAKRVKLALQLVAGNPIYAIGLPALAQIQDDPARLRAGILRSLTLICAFCCPIFFGASAVAHEAITVVFGWNWVASIPVLQWLAMNGLAMVLLTFNDNIFVLENRPSWCLWVSLSYAVLSVVTVLVFAHLKLTSLALPFVLPYAVVLPLSVGLMARRVKISFLAVIGAVLPGLSASILMLVVVLSASPFLAGNINSVRLAMLCIIGIITYVAAMFIFWRPTAFVLIDLLKHFRSRKNPAIVAS